MIVPGFDRIDGTAVNNDMPDDLWEQHTTEVYEAYEQEQKRDPELTMSEFAGEYAHGRRKTTAMVEVEEWQKRQDKTTWVVDEYASRLKMCKGVWPAVNSPGLVLASGCGFPFRTGNEAMAQEFKKLTSLVAQHQEMSRVLYMTPAFAMHVTIATPLKFNTVSTTTPVREDMTEFVDSWRMKLQSNTAFQHELARGPIKLVATKLEVRGGSSIVLLYEDHEGRLQSLRNTLQNASPQHIPDIVHSTVARLCAVPGRTFQSDALPLLLNSWNPQVVEIDTVDLVLENIAGFMHGFPQDVMLHYDLTVAATTATSSINEEEDAITRTPTTPTNKDDDANNAHHDANNAHPSPFSFTSIVAVSCGFALIAATLLVR